MSKISKQKAKERKRIEIVNVEPQGETKTVTCPKCKFVQSKKDYCILCGQDLRG